MPSSCGFITSNERNPVGGLAAEGGDRLRDEVGGQPGVVGPLRVSVGVGLVERARRDTRLEQAEHQPGEGVGHIELPDQGAVRQDHVGAEDRDRQAAQIVRLTQQYLAGPLAVAVAVGVAVVDRAHRADRADVAVLLEHLRIDGHRDRDRRQVRHRLDAGGDRQPDDFRRANDVGTEHLSVGQHVVDQCGGMHDQVDALGQPLPRRIVQTEVRFTDVSRDHLEVLGGQRTELREQLRVAAVEDRLQPGPRGVGVGAPDDGDQRAARLRQPLQPFEGKESSEIAVGAGQQDRLRVTGSAAVAGQLLRGVQRGAVDELVQGQVACPHLLSVGAVHGREGGALGPGRLLRLDVEGEVRQACRRADDDADRHLDVEDLLQQVGEGQRRQRVAAEVDEVRVAVDLVGARAEQCLRGQDDGVDHGLVDRGLAQRAQFVHPRVGQIGVQLLEAFAVVRLQLWPQHLADSGEQAVGRAERLGLDQEVRRDLVGLQLGGGAAPLKRAVQGRLEGVGIAGVACAARRRWAPRPPAGWTVRCCRRRRSAGPAGRRRRRPPGRETATNSPWASFITLLRRST